jgi:hypothetical protein
VLARVIYAGTRLASFELASQALQHLGDLAIPTKQVERLTQRIGKERCAERDAAVTAYQALPLAQRKAVPADVAAPDLAVVQVDGGRLQILDRSAAQPERTPTEAGRGEASTAETEAKSAGHWREDKVGLLATMTSTVQAEDPCPTVPEHFVNPLQILKLAREIKGSAGVTEDDLPSAAPELVAAAAPVYTAPELEQRSVAATRQDASAFGKILAQAAWERGFYGATRQVFVADGSSTNWGVWERHFSSFTPVVDFIHALTYVFQAALAGRPFALGWPVYQEWISQVWAGQIEPVIAALAQRQVALGVPAADEPETSPRQRVAEALSYLQNQKERMRYADYRRQGLPITSSHIESTIKQINQRVKGTEKFWSPEGAEAILQLRADALSETAPLESFWERRQARTTGQRPYHAAA